MLRVLPKIRHSLVAQPLINQVNYGQNFKRSCKEKTIMSCNLGQGYSFRPNWTGF